MNQRFPLFDSMRAIAALSVVAFHAAYFTGHIGGEGSEKWLAQLNIGVAIFFLVSGFLLYRPFVAARFSDKPQPPLAPYAVRRALRIVPAYWVLLIAAATVFGIAIADSPGEFLRYLTFTQIYTDAALFGGDGIGHAWTLCVEVTFYAMLPLWAWLMRRMGAPLVTTELIGLAVLAFIAVVWRMFVVDYPNGFPEVSSAVVMLPAYLDHFAAGMALAVASVVVARKGSDPLLARAENRSAEPLGDRARARKGSDPLVVRAICERPWVPWLAAVGLFLILGALTSTTGRAAELARQELKALVAVGILLPAIFGDPTRGWVRKLLAHRVLLWFGVVSYGLYLWHPPIMRELLDAGMSGGPYVVVSVALSIAAAAASWYLVERWFIHFGKRLLHRPAREPDRDAAFAEPAP